MKRIVVVGGGIGGIYAASLLSSKFPRSEMFLVERSHDIGGLLSGTRSECGLYNFDTGTHIFQETGNNRIDNFLKGIAPENDLLVYPVGEGDLSGAVLNGRLQETSHFPDLVAESRGKEMIGSVLDHLRVAGKIEDIDRFGKLSEELRARFGEKCSDGALCEILEFVFEGERKNLCGMAALLPGLTRVLGVNEEEWMERSGDDNFRAVVGWPEQRSLPDQFRHGRRSFYGGKEGTGGFIRGGRERLRSLGVKILTNCAIASLDQKNRRAELIHRGEHTTLEAIDLVVIASGVFSAGKILGVSSDGVEFDRPLLQRIVNLVFAEELKTDLCYFYGFSRESDFYRVTNYPAFSQQEGDCRATIEVIGREEIDDEQLSERIVEQFIELGILERPCLQYSNVRRLGFGFPNPTQKSLCAIRELNDRVEDVRPEWVLTAGAGTGKCDFFQNEILLRIDEMINMR